MLKWASARNGAKASGLDEVLEKQSVHSPTANPLAGNSPSALLYTFGGLQKSVSPLQVRLTRGKRQQEDATKSPQSAHSALRLAARAVSVQFFRSVAMVR